MNLAMEDTRLMEFSRSNNSGTDKDTLYLLGGAALMLMGAGLILSNPVIRRYMGQIGVGGLVASALPDLDRYLKLRQM